MKKYYFVAVNFNGSDFTKKYIESINALKSSPEDDIRIIIVDNASGTDDKAKISSLAAQHSNVTVIWSAKNEGYFKGLNIGIESVAKDNDTIMIVGNNDLTFYDDFIINLQKIVYPEDVLVIAPNIITKEGRQQNPHVVKEVSKLEKFRTAVYYSNYCVGQAFRMINQSIIKVRKKPVSLNNDYGQMRIRRGIGACYVLTEHFFRHFDKLDDSVFMWGEEALLSNQIESAGGATLYDPTIRIIHHERASVSSIRSKQKYYITKKSYKIYKKYL